MMVWNIIFSSLILSLLIFTVFHFLIMTADFTSLDLIKSRLRLKEQVVSKSDRSMYLRLLRCFPFPSCLSKVFPKNLLIWSGIQIAHQDFLALWWSVFVVCAVFAGGMILVGAGNQIQFLVHAILACAAMSPYLIAKLQIQKRKRDLERTLPDYLDMLSLTMEAGFGLVPALQRINGSFSGALSEIIQGAVLKINLGYSKAEALNALVSQTPSTDLSQFIDAILIADQLGTSLARTIRIQAGLSRSRHRQRAEIKARTTPIRIIPALVFFFLPGLLLIYLAPPIINFLALK